MGTRSLTMVLLNNEIKVAQYCSWDGHLKGGEGQVVLYFINEKLLRKSCFYDKDVVMQENVPLTVINSTILTLEKDRRALDKEIQKLNWQTEI